MVRACCVLGCPSGVKVPSHRFPGNPKMFIAWKIALPSLKRNILNDEELKKCMVCYLHFKDTDYVTMDYKYRKLRPDIVPSINLMSTNVNLLKEQEDKNIMEFQHSQEVGILKDDENWNARSSLSYHRELNLSNEIELRPKSTCFYDIICKLRKKQHTLFKQMLLFRWKLKQAEKKYTQHKNTQSLISKLSHTQKQFIRLKLRVIRYKPKILKMLCRSNRKVKALACNISKQRKQNNEHANKDIF
ncbi:uncharacterized protein LOC122637820 isoform X1 [Vespula pensylvanica]|uniref:uncharacterized protein LOC122637820 isoform X1 n=2 Tax=Vespula pensylvanica TaxID=30213 RepID=UPI001CBA4DA4|nr:uncharacterized protein LOC122637820 isoform X1 [Vespula pensylvanica]